MFAAAIFSEIVVDDWLLFLGINCWNRLAETNVRSGVVVGVAIGSSMVAACCD
jgi:hypothetical protein